MAKERIQAPNDVIILNEANLSIVNDFKPFHVPGYNPNEPLAYLKRDDINSESVSQYNDVFNQTAKFSEAVDKLTKSIRNLEVGDLTSEYEKRLDNIIRTYHQLPEIVQEATNKQINGLVNTWNDK
jgi:hypothetical protein